MLKQAPPPGASGQQKLRYLSAQEVLQDLSPAEMEWLAHVTTMATCQKGQLIYSPDQHGEALYLLKQGSVELYRLSPEGKKLIVAHLPAGSFFGEMSLLGQAMYDTFAEALEPCVLCAMQKGDVERLILTKPQVGLRMLQALGRRVMEMEAAMEDIAFKTVTARIASLLLRLRRVRGDNVITGLTHQDLAAMSGMLRETATEALNELKSRGLVDIGRTRIEVLDPEGLQHVAEAE